MSTPFAFEVLRVAVDPGLRDGFVWQIIGDDGRVIVYDAALHSSDFEAAEAAKIARAEMQLAAQMVDGQ
ncbi:hypothetical protein [Novosphingobium sp. FKTRR1]|uniref:hypothetical protein n=1 Tax=Novosphingobium sp. FKTRR1 TaxID=2879118 RepID=UPI001CEFB5A7|nr:hypothetical protein [Novosphingobium sp. FKTRR1]